MTRFQALVIKVWRVRRDCSWRRIHSLYQERYIPEEEWWYNEAILKVDKSKSHPHGNQINGMDLCNEAILILGDSVEDGWN